MQLRLSKLADFDLDLLTFDGTLSYGIKRSGAYVKTIFAVLDLVCNSPELGYLVYPDDFPNLRRTQSGSHMIFYYPHKDHIWVSRIAHHSMDFDKMYFIDGSK